MQIFLFIIAVVIVAIFFSLSSADREMLFGKKHTFEYAGLQRSYRLYKPSKPSNPSLILVLHGLGSNSRQMAYITGMHNVVDDNTIVVYPDATPPTKAGTKAGWNTGFCCGSGWLNRIDDAGFIAKLIEQISAQYNVDKGKIFVAGFSNGAMMAQRLAIDLPDTFSGFAAVAGSIGTKQNALAPSKPHAGILVHGEKDNRIPFDGGNTETDPEFIWRPFSKQVQAWEAANQCGDPQLVSSTDELKVQTYKKCSAPLQVVSYPGSGHVWPDWRLAKIWHKQPEGSQRVVDFFASLTK